MSDFELYVKYTKENKYINREKEFLSKMLEYLEMSKEKLEEGFNLAEEKIGIKDDSILILLAMMRRQAIAYFDPVKKTKCDICLEEDNKIIILKDCYHGYCVDCITQKVKSSTNGTFSYDYYFQNQKSFMCEIADCKKPITISNIEALKILQKEDNLKLENEFVMKYCGLKIGVEELRVHLKSVFKIACQEQTLNKIICPNIDCQENVSYLLAEFIDNNDIIKYFPDYYKIFN